MTARKTGPKPKEKLPADNGKDAVPIEEVLPEGAKVKGVIPNPATLPPQERAASALQMLQQAQTIFNVRFEPVKKSYNNRPEVLDIEVIPL